MAPTYLSPLRAKPLARLLTLLLLAGLSMGSSANAADPPEKAQPELKEGRLALRMTAFEDGREFILAGSPSAALPRGGRVTLGRAGFPGGDVGDVEWKLAGDTISGRVTRGPAVVGTFTGRLSRDAASGVFMAPDGTTIEWSWKPDTQEGPGKR